MLKCFLVDSCTSVFREGMVCDCVVVHVVRVACKQGGLPRVWHRLTLFSVSVVHSPPEHVFQSGTSGVFKLP